jgi:integrase
LRLEDIEPNHPLSLFISMLGSSESIRQYPPRLKTFFDFLKINGDIKEQAITFVAKYKRDKEGELEKQLIMFTRFQKERVNNKEVSPSTVPNYFKAIKLFCQANRLSNIVEWKLVSKGIPRGLKAADDRAPTLEEIQKLLEYPDRRIGPLVLTLVSSGIRIGAFETLKWKHITPIYNKDKNEVIAAKILVYPGDREQYFSFVTPEAYTSLNEWMNYRSKCGEQITKESYVMRDIWQTDDIQGIQNPHILNQAAITRLLNRAWQAQKIRTKLSNGERHHEFKTAHGFRKYFKTQAEQARIPSIKIELLMGHSLGVSDSYVRFTQEQILEDYLQIVDYLTVNQTIVLINKSLKKQEETIRISLKEMEERHKKEIDLLTQRYKTDISFMQENMERRFSELVDKIDIHKLIK